MKTRLFERHTAILLLGFGLGLSAIACDQPRGSGSGLNIPKDASVVTKADPTDSATNGQQNGDASVDDAAGCGGNPNQCVLHELTNPSTCACLGICEAGYRFQGTQCVLVGDGGVASPDGGVPTNPLDGGVVPVAQCATSAQCGGGGHCLDFSRFDPVQGLNCTGGANCQCFANCDPFAAASGCAATTSCFWWDELPGMRGACVPTQAGGTQGQNCTAQFDAQGGRTGDSCNVFENHRCLGATPSNPTGRCARLCNSGNAGLCSSLGNFQCDSADPIGFCLNPKPTYTDTGAVCTSPADCQGLNRTCSQMLANSCSASCANMDSCASNAVCLVAPNEGPICVKLCPGGESSCRPMDTVCENIGDAQSPLNVCIPGCTDNAQCPSGNCNTSTGHCG